MQLSANTLLQGGKYRIEKVLGQGGFGITYQAVQVALNRKVAIKEFFMKEYCERDGSTSRVSLGTSGNREEVERFRQKFIKEANIILQLNHPHIIKIFDIFQENGTAYYVMEYWDNGSLADYVGKRGKLGETEALGYISQVADALSYLHNRKINHLDVKPGNLLLDRDMNILLIDFGTSKRYNKEEKETSTTPVPHSAGYTPLEQYNAGGVSTFSPQADIYSLGATLYKMLTGKTPPEASCLIDEDLPPLPAKVSKTTVSAIKAAMQPSKKKRPQSVEEFMALLGIKTKERKNNKVAVVDAGQVRRPVIKEKKKSREELMTLLGESSVNSKGDDVTIITKNERIGAPQKEAISNSEKATNSSSFSAFLGNMLGNGCAMMIMVFVLLIYYVIKFVINDNQPPTDPKLENIMDKWKSESDKIYAQNTEMLQGTINEHEYVDLGLSVKWATCNIGADNPEDYGDYFAWGETCTKSTYTKENSITYEKDFSDIAGNSNYDAARANWGGSWRLPTMAELEELKSKCTWTWIPQGGHNGYKVMGSNGNSIFLPAAGERDGTSLINAGKYGGYWSSTPNKSNAHCAFYLNFFSGTHDIYWYYSRFHGQSIRPVSD